MEWIDNLEELPSETITLLKRVDYLIRETGECPTKDWRWVEIEKMRRELYKSVTKLQKQIGQEKYDQILSQIMKQIDDDVLSYFVNQQGFIGLLTKGLKDLIIEFENSGDTYTPYEVPSEVGDNLARSYLTLYAKMNSDRVLKLKQHIFNSIKEEINKNGEN